jgi:hypothetical protein
MRKEIKLISELTYKILQNWQNDYLTIEVFAEHYGLSDEAASKLIEFSQYLFEQRNQFDFPKDK